MMCAIIFCENYGRFFVVKVTLYPFRSLFLSQSVDLSFSLSLHRFEINSMTEHHIIIENFSNKDHPISVRIENVYQNCGNVTNKYLFVFLHTITRDTVVV